jgi:hypothetical protein
VSDNATVYEWFGRWMRYHQRLYQHLKGWVDPGDDEYYLGWVEALARAGATEDLAMHASRLLQARKAFRSDHLAMLVEIVGDLRRKAAEAGATRLPVYTAEQLDAMQASAACPECDGTGWARRRAAWHSIPRPFVVDLYCRCPHGRWRRLGADGNHDDLQGRPELWDPALDSPTWSAEATALSRPRRVGPRAGGAPGPGREGCRGDAAGGAGGGRPRRAGAAVGGVARPHPRRRGGAGAGRGGRGRGDAQDARRGAAGLGDDSRAVRAPAWRGAVAGAVLGDGKW